ncbi:MAG: hypothetical protein WKG32_15445 [Gemmatimonadaceae bacterium]
MLPLHSQVLEPGYAQRRAARPSRTFGGLDLLVMQPIGEFGDFVDVGGGIGGHLIQQLDRRGITALRFDLGFVVYGSETKRFNPFPRIEAKINTDNSIFFAGVGPQLMVPNGKLRPYVSGSAGLSYFATNSSLEGADAGYEDLLNTTNFDDATFAYSGIAGLYIPFKSKRRPVSLDVSARYQNNGVASYLREGSIIDNPNDNGYSVVPIRSRTDFVVYQLGVSIGF